MSIRRASASLMAPLRPLLSTGARMVPGFLVVGTKRGGSTSAYHWIVKHPSVAPCRTQKGTHYFDVNYGRGRDWFLSGFPKVSPQWQITGEASPYYMFHPLAPARIASTLPHVKLIVVLRDPVARAWSQHQYETARGTEGLPFAEALEREEERVKGEEDRLRNDPSYESFEHRHHTYLRRGHYAEQLTTIFEHFPVRQVAVVQSEALFADPHGQLSRLWDFLGLRQVTLEGLTAMKAGSYDAMPGDTVRWLKSYYAPRNEQLYDLPGVDFRWEPS